ncbi:MAG: MarR family transcriptional regulator [Candidatus Micrarchaeota archaeon]|nr:MarR family transcriptional regulator [Candidatus Micrarchaeota archaeon]MDE1859399.1 MarR family transcriptional regulator [Candidatus Micrarchaeota archaeon]
MHFIQDSIGTLLFKDKQIRILSILTTPNREWHISDLAKEANVTYIHTSKFIKKCEEYGIVTAEKHGRTKKLILTEKGNYIAKSVANIQERMKLPEQTAPKAQSNP